MLANDTAHYKLLDKFRSTARLPNATRSNAHKRQGELRDTYGAGPSKLLKFRVVIRDLNMLERHVHFIGKDWIASFNFGQKSVPTSVAVPYYATRLHIRGNRSSAEEAILLAYMHNL